MFKEQDHDYLRRENWHTADTDPQRLYLYGLVYKEERRYKGNLHYEDEKDTLYKDALCALEKERQLRQFVRFIEQRFKFIEQFFLIREYL